MIFTSDLIRIRESLLQVTTGDWLWLFLGLILGGTFWVIFNRKVVRKLVGRLKDIGLKENPIAIVEGAVGFAVMASNAVLLYLCNLCCNFFLFSFSLIGLLVGAWILIPTNFN